MQTVEAARIKPTISMGALNQIDIRVGTIELVDSETPAQRPGATPGAWRGDEYLDISLGIGV